MVERKKPLGASHVARETQIARICKKSLNAFISVVGSCTAFDRYIAENGHTRKAIASIPVI